MSDGLSLRNVVHARIYLTNLSGDFGAVNTVGVSHAHLLMNQVWTEVMPDPKPARTCIAVKELPEALILKLK